MIWISYNVLQLRLTALNTVRVKPFCIGVVSGRNFLTVTHTGQTVII